MIREKTIHKMNVKIINENHLILFVLASAGTYIKEFVHSDLQRTTPNLGILLENSCDILQLDVLHLYEHFDMESLNHFNNIA